MDAGLAELALSFAFAFWLLSLLLFYKILCVSKVFLQISSENKSLVISLTYDGCVRNFRPICLYPFPFFGVLDQLLEVLVIVDLSEPLVVHFHLLAVFMLFLQQQ
jgi:hypothetical protein